MEVIGVNQSHQHTQNGHHHHQLHQGKTRVADTQLTPTESPAKPRWRGRCPGSVGRSKRCLTAPAVGQSRWHPGCLVLPRTLRPPRGVGTRRLHSRPGFVQHHLQPGLGRGVEAKTDGRDHPSGAGLLGRQGNQRRPLHHIAWWLHRQRCLARWHHPALRDGPPSRAGELAVGHGPVLRRLTHFGSQPRAGLTPGLTRVGGIKANPHGLTLTTHGCARTGVGQKFSRDKITMPFGGLPVGGVGAQAHDIPLRIQQSGLGGFKRHRQIALTLRQTLAPQRISGGPQGHQSHDRQHHHDREQGHGVSRAQWPRGCANSP